ncbi:MAG TPA: adenylosuccinate synthetase [Propionicimonas sp.]|nr:adenylosuccinate synthetase [Propionicimonas sp.]
MNRKGTVPFCATVTLSRHRAYVRRLEELVGTRISGIGVGPSREQVVMLHDLL